MTSTTSSMVMRPSSRPSLLTTAAETRSRSWNSCATSWRGHLGLDARRLAVHQLARPARSGSSVSRRVSAHGAEVAVAPIHDEQAVGFLGQLAAHAQVAQHHFHGDIRPHAHRVGVHQTAGAVLREAEHRAQALAVLLIHGLQQRCVTVSGRSPTRSARSSSSMSSAAASSSSASMPSISAGAHVLVQLDQHFALELGIHEVPDHLALRGRQRLDEQRDLGRMQRVDHAVRGTQRALASAVRSARRRPAFSGLSCAFMESRREARRECSERPLARVCGWRTRSAELEQSLMRHWRMARSARRVPGLQQLATRVAGRQRSMRPAWVTAAPGRPLCRAVTFGKRCAKCSASRSTIYTERCCPPVQPMATVR